MSESNQVPEPNKMWTTKMKDGELQIVEVTEFNKSEDDISETNDSRDLKNDNQYATLHMQMVETDKGLMQLDLLNMTLVRCEESESDGNESYRLFTGAEATEMMQEEILTVACVLQQSDGENDDHEENSFIVMDGDKEPFVYLPPSSTKEKPEKPKTQISKPVTPSEILQKAKAIQKAKAAMNLRPPLRGRPGRRKIDQTSNIQDLVSSSTLKLYLYSCKLCPFKCNAVKELSAHRKKQHGTGAGRGRGSGGRHSSPMQCAGCTFRATSHAQLFRHVQEKHNEESKTEIVVARSSEDVSRLLEESNQTWGSTHVLVCGSCGMETSTAAEFKAHPCSPIVLD